MAKKSFNELNKAELVLAAQRYGSNHEGTAAEIRASLAEDGIEWDTYATDFGLTTITTPSEVAGVDPNVVKSTDINPSREVTQQVTVPVAEVEVDVVTVDNNPVLPQGDRYLIKMNRDNPYFEFGRYKFTTDNPFQVMPMDDAERILTEEFGFAQATPLEAHAYFKGE